MEVAKVIQSRRTIRRFTQKAISVEILKELIDGARLAPSAGNLQPIEYIITVDKKICQDVFSTLKWAGYIKPEWKPADTEQPTAYIIMLTKKDTPIDPKRDVGLAAAHIILAAEEKGIGSCILLNVNREKLQKVLHIPQNLIVDCVIALGYKAEISVIEPMNQSCEYWRDKNNVHHVPKRSLDDIVHLNRY
ncbi:MAG: nitroreductase family protein [Candidatus Thermoplasmatota archaeon]